MPKAAGDHREVDPAGQRERGRRMAQPMHRRDPRRPTRPPGRAGEGSGDTGRRPRSARSGIGEHQVIIAPVAAELEARCGDGGLLAPQGLEDAGRHAETALPGA